MQSYLEVLNDFIQNGSAYWNYYGLEYHSADEIFSAPLRFIHSLFEQGQKRMLSPFFNHRTVPSIESFLSEERAAHSVSTFLFGAMIVQKIFASDFAVLYSSPPTARRLDKRDRFDFSYIWTLTSLFHDYGYYYEQSSSQADSLKESRLS